MKPASTTKCALLFLAIACLSSGTLFSQITIVPYGSTWKYLADGTDQGTAWRAAAFVDNTWPSGASELGYGDADEATCVPSGGTGTLCVPTGTKYMTTYFRKTINIPNPSLYTNFTLSIKYDDGAVVYLNGTEIARARMTGVVSYSTAADAPAIDDQVSNFTISSASFVAGDNVIAVEVHQQTAASSDLSFNLQLVGNDAFASTATRGPYLQMANETAITIRWRTSAAQNSRVELGTTFGTYPTVVTDASSVTEHIIRVTGLTADTKYYYRIGNSTNMGGPDADKYFTTNPPANTTRKIRITAFGDCGRNSTTYQDNTLSNYRSYLTANGIDAPDAWILLGDNAYSTGSDAEYTSNFFNIYGPSLLKNHKLYSAPGNHDYGNSAGNKTSRVMPYYSNFTTPQSAECGGVSSGKPNFYSFDIGNIHFLSLDSWGIESDGTDIGSTGTTALKTWLTADLAANTKKWIIAYWHHPPYTKSSHDSDNGGGSDSELPKIRQNFISFLETRGVDLIICGHAHAYERSYLLRNFTGAWTSFSAATHAVSSSSATYTSGSTCPYVYNQTPLNHGTVYVVAGSAGASGGTNTNFGAYAMPYAVNDGGILYFEVEDNRLDAKMLRQNGTVFDRFTIMKDVNKKNDLNVVINNPVTLTASWPNGVNNYSWTGGANTRSIVVTPAVPGLTKYAVADNFGCLLDSFNVTASSTLPVSLLTYDVRLNGNKVDVNWSTATESNNRYFSIERSLNGRDFNAVGTVNAAGTSSIVRQYSFADYNPVIGTSYYRLSQTNSDNSPEYFGIKRIEYNIGKDLDVKMISASNGTLILRINSASPDIYRLHIYDLVGREWKNEIWNVPAGISNKEIKLSNGAYVWEISSGTGKIISRKVIIQ